MLHYRAQHVILIFRYFTMRIRRSQADSLTGMTLTMNKLGKCEKVRYGSSSCMLWNGIFSKPVAKFCVPVVLWRMTTIAQVAYGSDVSSFPPQPPKHAISHCEVSTWARSVRPVFTMPAYCCRITVRKRVLNNEHSPTCIQCMDFPNETLYHVSPQNTIEFKIYRILRMFISAWPRNAHPYPTRNVKRTTMEKVFAALLAGSRLSVSK